MKKNYIRLKLPKTNVFAETEELEMFEPQRVKLQRILREAGFETERFSEYIPDPSKSIEAFYGLRQYSEDNIN